MRRTWAGSTGCAAACTARIALPINRMQGPLASLCCTSAWIVASVPDTTRSSGRVALKTGAHGPLGLDTMRQQASAQIAERSERHVDRGGGGGIGQRGEVEVIRQPAVVWRDLSRTARGARSRDG